MPRRNGWLLFLIVCLPALVVRCQAAAPATEPAPRPVTRAGIPFIPPASDGREGMLKRNGQSVVLPCASIVADRVYLLGMTQTPDRGSPTWMVPAGNRGARYFIGTRVGEIEITYADGASSRVPLIFGFDLWWYKTFEDGYVAPFDSADGHAALEQWLHLQPTGDKPPGAFVVSIKLDAKPVSRITLIDEPKMEGTPVIETVTLHRAGGGYSALAEGAQPVALAGADGSLPDWDKQKAIDPASVDRDATPSVEALRKLLYTDGAALEAMKSVPLTIPKDYPADAPRVCFKGDLAADLLTNEFYANIADTLAKTEGGRYRTSTPGATNFGRYTGIGTWKDGVGWNQNRAWSRDFGAALIEVAHLGFQDRAEKLADYAFRWARWYPEHHIAYPDGTPTPAHWTRAIDKPEEMLHNMIPQGCAENDGHGLLMLATHQVYLRTPDRAAWARQHWPDLQAAAEWICWQFEHPAVSHATRLLYTESECSRPGHHSVYADFMCSEGLRAYAEIADGLGEKQDAARWRERAASMEAAELDVYPADNPTYGRVWNNPVTWSGRYPMLGPLITLADRRGLLASAGPEWDRLNSASYQFELHEHAPELPAWHMAATGYGQCFITESALLLDQMADAGDLLEVLAKASYFPAHEPYILPEAVEWTDDHRFWLRKSDLGNGVQQANFLKVIRLLAGIDDSHPDALRLLPRIPRQWNEFSISNYPVLIPTGIVHLTMTLTRPTPGALNCDLHWTGPAPAVALRLGPFDRSIRSETTHVATSDGRPLPFTIDPRGDSAWIWLREFTPAPSLRIEATTRRSAEKQ